MCYNRSMKIIKEKNNKQLILFLEGELNSTNSSELEDVIKNDLNDVDDLVFDFAKLDYLSSAGLRVLLVAQKIMNKKGQMSIRHVNQNVDDIFKLTGFSNILNIEN